MAKHAKANVAPFAVRLQVEIAAGVVAEDAGDADQVDAQRRERAEALAQHLRGEAGARLGARPGVRDLALGQPALLAEDVDLQGRRARVAANARSSTRARRRA